jgi:hypothetical protein
MQAPTSGRKVISAQKAPTAERHLEVYEGIAKGMNAPSSASIQPFSSQDEEFRELIAPSPGLP